MRYIKAINLIIPILLLHLQLQLQLFNFILYY